MAERVDGQQSLSLPTTLRVPGAWLVRAKVTVELQRQRITPLRLTGREGGREPGAGSVPGGKSRGKSEGRLEALFQEDRRKRREAGLRKQGREPGVGEAVGAPVHHPVPQGGHPAEGCCLQESEGGSCRGGVSEAERVDVW